MPPETSALTSRSAHDEPWQTTPLANCDPRTTHCCKPVWVRHVEPCEPLLHSCTIMSRLSCVSTSSLQRHTCSHPILGQLQTHPGPSTGIQQARCRPLASDERRVAGRFTLKNPVTNTFAGHVRVTVEWAQVLQPIHAAHPPAPAAAATQAAALEGMAPLSTHTLIADETIIEVSVLSAAVQVSFYKRASLSWPALLL